MRKLRTIVFLIFFIIVFRIDAQDLRFSWNIGNANMYYDILNNNANGGFEILHFNWMYNNYSIGLNILDIYYTDNSNFDEISQYLILPIKLSFVPLNFNDWLFFSVYSKGAWKVTKNSNNISNGFYGSVGIQLFIFPTTNFYYSPYFSTFFEYDTRKKLKIGFAIDLSLLFFLALKGYQGDKEKEYGKDFDWTK